MVKLQPSKLIIRVRFPLPAPTQTNNKAMKTNLITTAALTALSFGAFAAAADFQLLDKITAAQPTAQAVSAAVGEELKAYPDKAWEILQMALSKVTTDWSAEQVNDLINSVFASLSLDEISALLPKVKTLVASYSDNISDVEAVSEYLASVEDAVSDAVAASSAYSVSATAESSSATSAPPAAVTPSQTPVTPAVPPDVSIN